MVKEVMTGIDSSQLNHGSLKLKELDEELEPLANMQFRYPLRRYQKEILALVDIKLERGERELHIVAPPGAGKTIIGLQIISQFKCPSLIISPNTVIQSQWRQKAELFVPPDEVLDTMPYLIGTHEDNPPKPITLLTYQVLSTPASEQPYIEKLAHEALIAEMSKARGMSRGEAEMRTLELLQNNPQAHQKEISRHASTLRRKLTETLDLNEVLHKNALNLLQVFKRQKFGLIIFDECHHLTDYWAAIMIQFVKQLGNPIVLGLTGTPPEEKSSSQETRYLSLVGEIDYQVPTPALVKESGLAPFQDLVYFTEPTEPELVFLEEQHQEFQLLINELAGESSTAVEKPESAPPPDGEVPAETALTSWVRTRVQQALQIDLEEEAPVTSRKSKSTAQDISDGKLKRRGGWKEFVQDNEELSTAFCRYLCLKKLPLPKNIEHSDYFRQSPILDDWMRILEDFASQKLKVSPAKEDHALFARIRSAARKLGYGITEQGLRKQASPVDRILAFSNSKPLAVAKILDIEYRNLDDRLRAVVVTDFEKMSVSSIRNLEGVLTEESGGAIAVLKTLLADPISALVNPCLVTGSLVLTDKRITDQFLNAAQKYIATSGNDIGLTVKDDPSLLYSEISSTNSSWESRFYVGMVTEIFELGITKCLIGTRGLFGEGWDSQSLNTLIDLTTTTSPVSVKQLRGRSIRLQANDPLGARKVANNWDVVCIAPKLKKGLNDYERFVKKHNGYFGICDDGQIACGVSHVHPAFSELTPAEVFISSAEFNREMTDRALIREKIYDLWKVGEPYLNRTLGCIDITALREPELTPPHLEVNMSYVDHAKDVRTALSNTLVKHIFLGTVISTLMALALFSSGTVMVAIIPFTFSVLLAKQSYSSLFEKLKDKVCLASTQESSLTEMAIAVLSALQEIKVLPEKISIDSIKLTRRSNGNPSIFLDDVDSLQSNYFTTCMKELLSPVISQPYVIPKYEYFIEKSDQDNDYTKIKTAFFKKYLSGKAQPKIAAYHPVPGLLARSERARQAFESAWNQYVSPGSIILTEKNTQKLNDYFGLGPSLAQRLLWE
jgi:superfamily II DNA or RNA helicase